MNKIRCAVIGDREIAGVGKGGTVDLDPAEVDIDALVEGGHVEPASKTAAKKLDTTRD